jgi:hypothetical protein
MRAAVNDIYRRHKTHDSVLPNVERVKQTINSLYEILVSMKYNPYPLHTTDFVERLITTILGVRQLFSQNKNVSLFGQPETSNSKLLIISLSKVNFYNNLVLPAYESIRIDIIVREKDKVEKTKKTFIIGLNGGVLIHGSVNIRCKSLSLNTLTAIFTKNLSTILTPIFIEKFSLIIFRILQISNKIGNKPIHNMYKKEVNRTISCISLLETSIRTKIEPDKSYFNKVYTRVQKIFSKEIKNTVNFDFMFESEYKNRNFNFLSSDIKQAENYEGTEIDHYRIYANFHPYENDNILIKDFKRFSFEIKICSSITITIPMIFNIENDPMRYGAKKVTVSIKMLDTTVVTFDLPATPIFDTCIWTYAEYKYHKYSESHAIGSRNCETCKKKYPTILKIMKEQFEKTLSYVNLLERKRIAAIAAAEAKEELLNEQLREAAREAEREAERKRQSRQQNIHLPFCRTSSQYEIVLESRFRVPFQILFEDDDFRDERFIRGRRQIIDLNNLALGNSSIPEQTLELEDPEGDTTSEESGFELSESDSEAESDSDATIIY